MEPGFQPGGKSHDHERPGKARAVSLCGRFSWRQDAALACPRAFRYGFTEFMAFLNDNYLKLKAGYLFPEIGRRVKVFCYANREAAGRIIRCGSEDL